MRTFLFIILIAQLQLNAQSTGTFKDGRDGHVYKTVTYEVTLSDSTISSMTWMAQNLNYKIEGSYCKDNSIANCDVYGRFYNWSAATKSCPQGWHLPTNEEWYVLVNLYGGVSRAGKHLKSKSSLWAGEGKGSNKSLFNAMPYGTGTKESGYHRFGLGTVFWSSSIKDEEYAWDWILSSGWTKILRSDGHMTTTGNCVRCVKN